MANPKAVPQRSDWQRNHQRLVAVAAALVARDGEQVSLEEIAREAGVGSATLHRHFASRQALLEEVFRDAVERLGRRSRELTGGDPGSGLVTWLEELTITAVNTRGLPASLAAGAHLRLPDGDSCHAVIRQATVALMDRARTAAAIHPEVSPDDLLALVEAIVQATEGEPPKALRLLHLALDGIRS